MPDPSNPEGTRPARKPRPAGAARPARPKRVTEMPAEPWTGSLPDALKERYGDGVEKATVLGGQQLLVVAAGNAHEVIATLKDDHGFDYLVDVTAVHWPEKDLQFEIVWILYSFALNQRVRVKAAVAEGSKAPTVTDLYNSANWLEREVYDMFGVEFENHPDLRRILMPDEWDGFPLRKEYGIVQQDAAWVRENLKIESAQ